MKIVLILASAKTTQNAIQAQEGASVKKDGSERIALLELVRTICTAICVKIVANVKSRTRSCVILQLEAVNASRVGMERFAVDLAPFPLSDLVALKIVPVRTVLPVLPLMGSACVLLVRMNFLHFKDIKKKFVI